MNKLSTEFEKDFDSRFCGVNSINTLVALMNVFEVKQFIADTLEKQKEDMVRDIDKRIELWKVKYFHDTNYIEGLKFCKQIIGGGK